VSPISPQRMAGFGAAAIAALWLLLVFRGPRQEPKIVSKKLQSTPPIEVTLVPPVPTPVKKMAKISRPRPKRKRSRPVRLLKKPSVTKMSSPRVPKSEKKLEADDSSRLDPYLESLIREEIREEKGVVAEKSPATVIEDQLDPYLAALINEESPELAKVASLGSVPAASLSKEIDLSEAVLDPYLAALMEERAAPKSAAPKTSLEGKVSTSLSKEINLSEAVLDPYLAALTEERVAPKSAAPKTSLEEKVSTKSPVQKVEASAQLSDEMFSEVERDTGLNLEIKLQVERKTLVVMSTLKKHKFEDLKLSLAQLKAETGKLKNPISPPPEENERLTKKTTKLPDKESVVAGTRVASSKIPDFPREPPPRVDPSDEMDLEKDLLELLEEGSESSGADEQPLNDALIPQESPEESKDPGKNILIQPENVATQPSLSKSPLLVNHPKPAPSVKSPTTPASKKSTKISKPQKPKIAQPNGTLAMYLQRPSGNGEDKARSGHKEPVGGRLMGRVTMDSGVRKDLDAWQAHIQLKLRPVGSPGVGDIFLDCDLFCERFVHDATHLEGKYQLLAKVIVPRGGDHADEPTSTAPYSVAPISYHRIISSENYKAHIRFHISEEDLAKAVKFRWSRPSEMVSLTVTLFDGGARHHRDPKVIKGGQVSVIGFEDWGVFRDLEKTESPDGNIILSEVPTNSELLLKIEAEGYFPTYRVVPIEQEDTYLISYLVHTSMQYHRPDKNRDGGVHIMGRVYDPSPSRRHPVAEREVELSSRKGSATYFQYWSGLPDSELKNTTKNGLFAFFGVPQFIWRRDGSGKVKVPFRTIRRKRKHGYLVSVRPGSAHYVEFGRGGEAALKGQVLDPYYKGEIDARVRIIGDRVSDETTHSYLDTQNEFMIEGIDFPPGIVTVEVEDSTGQYPLTWYSLPWSSRLSDRHTLFILPQDALEGSAYAANVDLRESLGHVIGGAENNFFKNGLDCVTVELFTDDGERVERSYGPFPFRSQDQDESSLCLSIESPGFAFFNLNPGQYILKWVDQSNKLLRSHIIRVGRDRVSMVVN